MWKLHDGHIVRAFHEVVEGQPSKLYHLARDLERMMRGHYPRFATLEHLKDEYSLSIQGGIAAQLKIRSHRGTFVLSDIYQNLEPEYFSGVEDEVFAEMRALAKTVSDRLIIGTLVDFDRKVWKDYWKSLGSKNLAADRAWSYSVIPNKHRQRAQSSMLPLVAPKEAPAAKVAPAPKAAVPEPAPVKQQATKALVFRAPPASEILNAAKMQVAAIKAKADADRSIEALPAEYRELAIELAKQQV